MPRLPLQTAETAPDASKLFIERAIAANGFLPNLIAVLANTPAAVEAYFTVGEINNRASLTLAEREVIQITAAALHGCEFCVAGHSAIALKKAGFDRKSVIALQQRGVTGNPRFDALVDFTRSIIISRGAVDDGELTAFIEAGFSSDQALEVILGISLATLCNFANNLAKNEINMQLQPFRPGALQA
ncbi:carboxymuconolactone decarboxylase family protein [Candidatus Methylospira mobilis]|uniref:Carboxymuconolactone decarboxylase family protein n=1 Tax=Candidatus Methylospira mobilis TaxID=1808979 RepID=A0A5Q0BKR9_9GAMM|nr:carboxymuconolactone decarboxylase family protein [Candidatus Methylospira mobilis]QFY44179.1 carboxymuconolactone decarboxylase family protein [Candidatus Methylospira mobilis]WNV06399.1 carboxymuconolactone decarboxylase family protein [Candidatus Methylospira mobilis]